MLPYPGIPYETAPTWSFLVFEGSMFLLLALCLLHAWRRHREFVPYILGGFLFGVLLEYMEVLSHSYTYSHFHVMLGHAPLDVPVCIGAGWGIILYTARLFSDRLGLSSVAAAALDTLLALNIDLSMDVVAYRLHMWHWYWRDTSKALTSQWFGIPYGNFNGWVTVVFCYSGYSRLFERTLMRHAKDNMPRRALIALLAFLCSLGTLFVTESFVYPFLLHRFGLSSGPRLTLLVAGLLLATILGLRKARSLSNQLPPIAIWVPCWFHVYFLFCFFVFAFYKENRWMTAAAVLNMLLGMAIHLWQRRATPVTA